MQMDLSLPISFLWTVSNVNLKLGGPLWWSSVVEKASGNGKRKMKTFESAHRSDKQHASLLRSKPILIGYRQS